ncbi:hypothetical protein QQ045_020985 [Rhodiola kirilowii]
MFKVFCWRLFYDSLPDAKNLCRRGITLDMRCKVCGMDGESAGHVVKDCGMDGESLWTALGLQDDIPDLRINSVQDWLWWSILSLRPEKLIWFLISLWLCWRNRNRKWHDEQCWDVGRAVCIGRNVVTLLNKSFQIMNVENSILRNSCASHSEDMVSVNCDCSWLYAVDHMGIGVCVRDKENVLLSVQAEVCNQSSCVSEGEGLAVLTGMKLAQRVGYTSVVFQIDSADVFKALCFGIGGGEWCMSWMEEASRLLERNVGWSMALISRESNVMADFLARKARQECWSWLSLLAIPRCLASLL